MRGGRGGGWGVRGRRVVVDNLEEMVGKGVLDEEDGRKVLENLDLLSGVTESDLYGTSVYPTRTNEENRVFSFLEPSIAPIP